LLPNCSGGIANPFDCAHQLIFGHAKMPRPRWPAFEHPFGFDLDQPTGQLCDAFESSPPDHFSAYKDATPTVHQKSDWRHAGSIRALAEVRFAQ
jgi:hypothetical protein